ncbi:hypothetical protein CPB84DRAFT_923981 [Gymnopilus junonius]|uniref:Uncharacterized protein n=1 Tax=Gymnopilus junonius TaxID=109634 RepID=A0A9P5P0E8_GYMJU|nr:hypothetical protein CPB84DRAFT_923981 [Gymnopilus junonius]
MRVILVICCKMLSQKSNGVHFFTAKGTFAFVGYMVPADSLEGQISQRLRCGRIYAYSGCTWEVGVGFPGSCREICIVTIDIVFSTARLSRESDFRRRGHTSNRGSSKGWSPIFQLFVVHTRPCILSTSLQVRKYLVVRLVVAGLAEIVTGSYQGKSSMPQNRGSCLWRFHAFQRRD